MSNDNINKAPPPGPMLPIENDRMSDLEAERRRLRAKADAATPPELRQLMRDSAKAYASSDPMPVPTRTKPNPQKSRQPMSNIVPVNAQGQPKGKLLLPPGMQPTPTPEPPPIAPGSAEQVNLVFRPGADGTFVKFVDRPRPPQLPESAPWSQKYLVNQDNKPFAIVPDGNVAKFMTDALNMYCIGMYARQQAAEAAAADANAFDAPVEGGGQ